MLFLSRSLTYRHYPPRWQQLARQAERPDESSAEHALAPVDGVLTRVRGGPVRLAAGLAAVASLAESRGSASPALGGSAHLPACLEAAVNSAENRLVSLAAKRVSVSFVARLAETLAANLSSAAPATAVPLVVAESLVEHFHRMRSLHLAPAALLRSQPGYGRSERVPPVGYQSVVTLAYSPR